MESSFYYFFSATPQVLAAILALFGVFVVFKIQNSKSLLIGIAKTIAEESNRIYLSHPTRFKLCSKRLTAIGFINELNDSVKRGDITETKNLVIQIDNEDFIFSKERYISIFNKIQSLIHRTILWSVFTAVAIVICLIFLPFSDFFINHTFVLRISFGYVIFMIISCFYGLISILINALKE
jgi:hypothetical protein